MDKAESLSVSFSRFFLDEDPTLTDDTTIRVVEHIVLLIATFVTEIKRLVFIENMFDSFKVLHSLCKINKLPVIIISTLKDFI